MGMKDNRMYKLNSDELILLAKCISVYINETETNFKDEYEKILFRAYKYSKSGCIWVELMPTNKCFKYVITALQWVAHYVDTNDSYTKIKICALLDKLNELIKT